METRPSAWGRCFSSGTGCGFGTSCSEVLSVSGGRGARRGVLLVSLSAAAADGWFSPAAASLYTVSSEGKNSSEGKKKVEVIDLTLDSSSDEEEPPAKKQCPVSSAALPTAAGPKG